MPRRPPPCCSLHSCSLHARANPSNPNAACAALKRADPRPARSACRRAAPLIESATLVAPSALAVRPEGAVRAAAARSGDRRPRCPEHCQVVGAIAPVDPKAPPIRFQVNLPTQWNGNSLQYGGGGFNGVLITGLALTPSARPDRPAPLARGYVTYGTDSGHQNAPNVPLQAFALNDEALVNFAHASYKKVRDVAVELMKRRYGAAPKKLYFFGSSEGGREGITMAQRYPADFDGIFSRVPVINWVGAAGRRHARRRGAVRRRLAFARGDEAGGRRGARRLRRARRPRRRHRQRLRGLPARLRRDEAALRRRAPRPAACPRRN